MVDIERNVRAKHPEVVSLFIKPQTRRTFNEHALQRYTSPEEPKSA